MTLEEAIKNEEKIAEENQRVVDTGIVFDDVTIDMLYCDDTEVIEEHLANYQECAERHRQFAEWLKELKQLREQTGWIPVSERLPEDIKPVIVTWKNTDPKSYYQYIVGKHFIGTAHYKNGAWFWYSSTTEDMLAEYGRCDSEEFDEAIEVIAWMPLPEPYEPQEKRNHERNN